MECAIQKVDADYRILLPPTILKRARWISGDAPLKAWLLLGSPGRCKMLSSHEVDNDPACRSLRAVIDAETALPASNLLEFRDEASVTLGLRLQTVEITPPGPGWRLALPRPIATIMQIRPKESSVALLFAQDHIEIWTMEALRASVTIPIPEII